MALILETGAKIDETGLADAFAETDTVFRYFLDTRTGDIGCFDTSIAGAKAPSDDRYIEVPRISAGTQLIWFSEMMRDTMDSEKDQMLIFELSEILHGVSRDTAADALALCEAILEKAGNGWIELWDEWSSSPLWDEIEQWLASLPIPIEDKFEGCGECDLCAMLGDGPRTIGDFLEAKQKAERKLRKKSDDDDDVQR